MFKNKTKDQDRDEILASVRAYCDKYHVENKKPFAMGDRIPYASRVYDSNEMCNLVDAALEFWLTSGRFTDEFEKKLAEYLGVKYCSLVNSGSSANLNAFMALTSPLLGERQVRPGWFGFLLTCKEGVDRNRVVPYLEAHGVQTRMLFAGNLTKHPCFDQMRAEGKGYRIAGPLDNTDRIMRDTFWVGVYPGMTDEMLAYMARMIREAVEG